MDRLNELGFVDALKTYIRSNRPFMGICVGMQCLYQGSDETPGSIGLGIIDAKVSKFNPATKAVPQIGWNAAQPLQDSQMVNPNSRYYFVHSYAVLASAATASESHVQDWCHTLTTYGDETFVSSVSRGNHV